MKTLSLGLVALTLGLGACATDDEPTSDGAIDSEIVATYRAALPTRAQLLAKAPQASVSAALGDPATFPSASRDIVVGINGAVGATIDLLELVTSLPPTFYNSETKELVWGPFPEPIGYSAAYIRDTGDEGDFRFAFAFLRGIGNDLATLTPVVWGGSTPDPSDADRGVGVAVWDMTAMRTFAQAHDPAFDPADHDSGRFAALFGRGPAENDPSAEMTLVVAVFRDFVPKDDLEVEPVDLDYLYGHYAGPEHAIDFIDWEANLDVTDPKDGVTEDLGVRMAFLDEGTGRAEADVTGGQFGGELVKVTECWDAAINQTYVDFNGEAALGELTSCGLFATALADLGVPSLDDVDAELLAALDAAASRGL
jgi:hypothetical protein